MAEVTITFNTDDISHLVQLVSYLDPKDWHPDATDLINQCKAAVRLEDEIERVNFGLELNPNDDGVVGWYTKAATPNPNKDKHSAFDETE